MKILIIEDEAHNARYLQKVLQEIDERITVLAVLESVEESVAWLQGHPAPDLALMDVRLADGLSFEIFSRITVPCPVIFTTAYDEYALRAFKVNSIDYLLKPVNSGELRQSLEKYRQTRERPAAGNGLLEDMLSILKGREQNYRQRFLLPFKDTYFTIFVKDISFFYSENRISRAVMQNGTEHHLPFTLEELEEQLHPDHFFRANRQYLVNSNSIRSIQNCFNGKLKVIMQPTSREDILVSREKAGVFKKWLDR